MCSYDRLDWLGRLTPTQINELAHAAACTAMSVAGMSRSMAIEDLGALVARLREIASGLPRDDVSAAGAQEWAMLLEAAGRAWEQETRSRARREGSLAMAGDSELADRLEEFHERAHELLDASCHLVTRDL